jgi:RNA polymerase sigma-70 factor, ECF subfamily
MWEKMDVRPIPQTKRKTVYEDLRPLLFSIAYRMVGSASEAEDIVQEAFLRFHRESEEGADIESPKAWLSTVTTRLAINHVQSARVRRETYVGTWLPEPLVTDTESEGLRHAETADSLSMAFLVLLESLGPVERAVFLLREVFDYGYDEIADIVGKTEDNCRQIGVRARRQIEAKKPRFEASRKKREELARRFFDAAMAGDTEGLIRLLAADVVAYGDGGGKAPAIPKPVYGREKVARLFLRARGIAVSSLRQVEVNGQPGALLLDLHGRPVVVVTVDIADGLVQTVRAVSNPDKLQHLDPNVDPLRLPSGHPSAEA